MKELKIEVPEGYEIDKEKSTFEKIVFKSLEKNYPKTWEECINLLKIKKIPFNFIDDSSKINTYIDPYPVSSNYNLLPSEEDAKKFLTLQKLWTCRKAYIGNWEPDWFDCETPKYVIKVKENELIIDYYHANSRSFSFPSSEMANEFLKNFKSDLEFVKDLI